MQFVFVHPEPHGVDPTVALSVPPQPRAAALEAIERLGAAYLSRPGALR